MTMKLNYNPIEIIKNSSNLYAMGEINKLPLAVIVWYDGSYHWYETGTDNRNEEMFDNPVDAFEDYLTRRHKDM